MLSDNPKHERISMKTNRLLPIILLLLTGLIAVGCSTFEAGVEGNSTQDQTARATVAALTQENIALATRIAVLEQSRPATAVSTTMSIPVAEAITPTAAAAAAPAASPTMAPPPTNAPTATGAAAVAQQVATATATATATPGPTQTPAATPTLHPPAPTATPGPCREANDQEKAILAAVPQLTCVTSEQQTLWMARQPFQHGQMIWRSDEPAIYVLYNDGTYTRYEDQWTEDQPVDDPTLRPPEGMLQPKRGFGRLWREQLGGANSVKFARIGWATEEEKGMDATVQQWKGGQIFDFGTGKLVLLNSGSPLPDSGTWQTIK
jgi:hypothetical protein